MILILIKKELNFLLIERTDTPVRIKGNKYNLANPIE